MFIILIKLVLISHKNKINGRVRNGILCIILQIFNILFIKFLLKYNTWRTEWESGVSVLYSSCAPAVLGEKQAAFYFLYENLFGFESLCIPGNLLFRTRQWSGLGESPPPLGSALVKRKGRLRDFAVIWIWLHLPLSFCIGTETTLTVAAKGWRKWPMIEAQRRTQAEVATWGSREKNSVDVCTIPSPKQCWTWGVPFSMHRLETESS